MAKHRYLKRVRLALIIALLSFIVVLSGLASYLIVYDSRVYPNEKVAGISLSGYKLADSISVLSEKVNLAKELNLKYQDQIFDIKTSDISLVYNASNSAKQAYDYTRTGNILADLLKRIDLLFHPKNFGLIYDVDGTNLTKIVSVISGQISVDPVDPTVNLTNGKIIIGKGTPGIEVDQDSLVNLIKESFSSNDFSDIEIPVNLIDHTLSQEASDELQARAEKYIGKNIEMKFESGVYSLNDTDIVGLLDPVSGHKEEAVAAYIQKTSAKINHDPQNPKFTFLPAQAGANGKVTEFQPALNGVKVDINQYLSQLTSTLDALQDSSDKTKSFDIPVVQTPPEVTTDKINNLGIKELIGRGTSTYFHSIPSRVHNVILAASRINGTLVKPGETFSFNDTLGDVSAFTGYQQAYIISGGKTILGDGGGVCQVSTTLFRAILNAGLPIVERAAHAYRVGYYEQGSPPGLDATVYGPEPDLKFTNDTPSYVLIEATADPKNYSLIFELYGTSDGRIATITKPVVTNITPALPTVYQDDPTLPAGTLKQVDFSAAGATVTFNYLVKKAGQTIFQKTFVSNYRPWAAVYLRGTK